MSHLSEKEKKAIFDIIDEAENEIEISHLQINSNDINCRCNQSTSVQQTEFYTIDNGSPVCQKATHSNPDLILIDRVESLKDEVHSLLKRLSVTIHSSQLTSHEAKMIIENVQRQLEPEMIEDQQSTHSITPILSIPTTCKSAPIKKTKKQRKRAIEANEKKTKEILEENRTLRKQLSELKKTLRGNQIEIETIKRNLARSEEIRNRLSSSPTFHGPTMEDQAELAIKRNQLLS